MHAQRRRNIVSQEPFCCKDVFKAKYRWSDPWASDRTVRGAQRCCAPRRFGCCPPRSARACSCGRP